MFSIHVDNIESIIHFNIMLSIAGAVAVFEYNPPIIIAITFPIAISIFIFISFNEIFQSIEIIEWAIIVEYVCVNKLRLSGR